MEIPDSYLHYAASFYPSLGRDAPSMEEFIAGGLRFLNREQFAELSAFLPRALDGGCAVADLQRAWMGAGSMFCLTDRDLPAFLRMTIEVMASEDQRPKREQNR